MWLFGNALALVYSLNWPNHRGLHAYTIRQLFVANIPKIWQYLFAFYHHNDAKLLKLSPLHGVRDSLEEPLAASLLALL
jgi:hypothetical protein